MVVLRVLAALILVRNRGFHLSTIGSTLWIPFVFAAFGSGFGGSASGMLMRRCSSPVLARKMVMVTGAALMLLGIPAFLVRSGATAIALICVVLFGYSSWAASLLRLPTDLFPNGNVVCVPGLLGTAGAIGGMLFGLATGWLVQYVSYGPVFGLASAMIICAAVAVVRLVPSREVV